MSFSTVRNLMDLHTTLASSSALEKCILHQFCTHLVTEKYCRDDPEADRWFPVWLSIAFD